MRPPLSVLSTSSAVTSALTETKPRSQIDFSAANRFCPVLAASDGLVVTPSTSPVAARAAVDAFLQVESIAVERVLKDGRRTLDARLPVVSLGVVEDPGSTDCAILEMVVRHFTPAVRPDDVLVGLRQVSDLAPPLPPLVTRLAQGHLDEFGRLADPLAPDREAAAGIVPAVEIPATP